MAKEKLSMTEELKRLRLINQNNIDTKNRKKIDNSVNKITKCYNQLIYSAYYDRRFNICNYNKLIDDLKDKQKGTRVNFLFFQISNYNKFCYGNEEERKTLSDFIEMVKTYVKERSSRFEFKQVYIVDNVLILVAKKGKTVNCYNELKKEKELFAQFGLYINVRYAKYKKTSPKISKVFDSILANTLNMKANEEELKDVDKD